MDEINFGTSFNLKIFENNVWAWAYLTHSTSSQCNRFDCDWFLNFPVLFSSLVRYHRLLGCFQSSMPSWCSVKVFTTCKLYFTHNNSGKTRVKLSDAVQFFNISFDAIFFESVKSPNTKIPIISLTVNFKNGSKC